MFYTYNQNNSGGVFNYSPTRGVGHLVIIEADSADHADRLFLRKTGERFNEGCSCCGPNWTEFYGEGDDEPKHYGDLITFHNWAGKKFGAVHVSVDRPGQAAGFIHYLDGPIVPIVVIPDPYDILKQMGQAPF